MSPDYFRGSAGKLWVAENGGNFSCSCILERFLMGFGGLRPCPIILRSQCCYLQRRVEFWPRAYWNRVPQVEVL